MDTFDHLNAIKLYQELKKNRPANDTGIFHPTKDAQRESVSKDVLHHILLEAKQQIKAEENENYVPGGLITLY